MKLPKNEQELEHFVRTKGMHPIGYYDYKGHMIYLAETELETDKKNEYPWGYYQVAWFARPATGDSKFDCGSWVEFDGMHNMDEPKEKRRQGRTNAAKAQANTWIEDNLSKERYA